MSEAEAVTGVQDPGTAASLTKDLRSLGLLQGSTVLVHSSLSALGWVAGSAQAVIEALLTAIGSEGTLAMPSHSAHLTEPSGWENPPVPESWWETIRDEMTPFEPTKTPTRGMGATCELFRSWPDVRRSFHPTGSFAALGPNADRVVKGHSLENQFGEGSPLARLYELDASVLLLGVGHSSNTSLHLAEYRSEWPGKKTITSGSPIIEGGVRRWVTYSDVDVDSDDFDALGTDFRQTGMQIEGMVGQGTCLLMRQRDVVDFAVSWIPRHRGKEHT